MCPTAATCPYVYASEEWFEFEKAAVYDRSWLCVGRIDLLRQPGDYYTVTINDDPLMVVMDDEGQVRVMSSVCQHRGHLLAEDSGNAEIGLFRCPLHHWSYDLKGRLRHAPEMGGPTTSAAATSQRTETGPSAAGTPWRRPPSRTEAPRYGWPHGTRTTSCEPTASGLISHLRYRDRFVCPYEDGWAKVRYISPQTLESLNEVRIQE